MPTHGSESYYVIGEGLLSESVGGREAEEPPSTASARRAGAGPAAAVPPFRFTRLGPKGVNKQLGEPNRKKIGGAMAVPRAGSRRSRPGSPTSASSSTMT